MSATTVRVAKWALAGLACASLSAAALHAYPVVRALQAPHGPADSAPTHAPSSASATIPPDGGWIRSEGRVVARQGAEAVVSAEAFGRLTAVPVRVGQNVDKGAVLAVLTSRDEQAQRDAAMADLHQAQADVTFFTAEARRARRLSRADHASAEALDRAVHDLAVATARRDAAQAAVNRAQVALDRRTVHAPLSGTIIQRDVDPGSTVSPGQPIVTIADLGQTRIEAQVDEFDLPNLHLGAAVRITAEGYGMDRWTGRVTRIPADIVPRTLRPQDPGRPEDTGVALARISLPPDAPLKLGQRVELWIATSAAPSH